ncbi:MAG: cyclase family protein [Pseudomonadota bacterium]
MKRIIVRLVIEGISMLIRYSLFVLAALAITLISALAAADDWFPSRFGAEDTLGAVALLSPEKVAAAAKLVKTGEVYALGVPTGPDSPAYGPRRYQMTILQLDDGSGTPIGANQLSGNDDLMNTWMGIGSQIDGLGHIGINHQYYNGLGAKDFVQVTGLGKFSIHEIPPIVGRGILLDMASYFGEEILPPGKAFNKEDIEGAAKAQGITVKQGDVVLFHTGWLKVADQDGKKFMSGEPGLGIGGARYLVNQGVVAVGSDTYGVEVIPFENRGQVFPVHQELLTKGGVYILENMDTRALAKDKANEFLFVLGQPRFVGAVQAIINPVAIR